MPGGDGTGPAGMGPMTGRAAGYCAGYPAPGYANRFPGRGFGPGFGRGMGFGAGRGWRSFWGARRNMYNAAMAPYDAPFSGGLTRNEEVDMLKGQADHFEETLSSIKKRISELENQPTEQK